MIRVLHIQKVTGYAGSERHLVTLLRHLDRSLFNVTMALLVPSGAAPDDFEAGLTRAGVAFQRFPIRGNIDPFLLVALARHMRRERFDLVHTHLLHADLYGTLAARLAGCATVVSSRHNDDPFRARLPIRALTRTFAKFQTQIVAISGALRQFVTTVEGIPAEKVTVVPYGIDTDMYVAAGPGIHRLREDWGVPADVPVVGVVARLTEQKGHSFLIEAFSDALAAIPEAYLVIVGDGELRESLQALTRRLGIEHRVVFTGWLRDTMSAIKAFDVFAHPSLWEGFGLAILEAMLAARPIVTTRVSAIPEVVGQTALLVEPRSRHGLTLALVTLLQDRERADRLGHAARERAINEFSPGLMARRTEDVYRAALGPAVRNARSGSKEGSVG